MWRFVTGCVVLFLVGSVVAQDDPVLLVDKVSIQSQVDVFGVEQQVASGIISNQSEDVAFADVQVFAEIYDADDEIVGEGIGFLVNQCGKNTPPDFTLLPTAEQRFVVTLELYEDDVTIDEVEFFPQGREVDPGEAVDEEPVEGIIPVSNRDVANIEWLVETPEDGDPQTSLLYGVGCYRDVFTTYDWYAYDVASDTTRSIEHPRYDEATSEALRERMVLSDEENPDEDLLFNRSFLSFPPNNGRRILFQTDINTLVTTEVDGTFRRIIDEELFRSTLQGITWLPDERFIAYYYGAYGDGVTYLAASTAGAYFSTPERFSTPSVTVPGAVPDLSALIISGTFNDDEIPGFYFKPPAAEIYRPIFEWENLPGNNYPAPVYRSRGGVQTEDVIYFALPDDENNPWLYCYDRREESLFDLAPLPFDLSTEDRAKMVLSPDGRYIGLGASGVNGGVWLIDVTAFDACTDE